MMDVEKAKRALDELSHALDLCGDMSDDCTVELVMFGKPRGRLRFDELRALSVLTPQVVDREGVAQIIRDFMGWSDRHAGRGDSLTLADAIIAMLGLGEGNGSARASRDASQEGSAPHLSTSLEQDAALMPVVDWVDIWRLLETTAGDNRAKAEAVAKLINEAWHFNGAKVPAGFHQPPPSWLLAFARKFGTRKDEDSVRALAFDLNSAFRAWIAEATNPAENGAGVSSVKRHSPETPADQKPFNPQPLTGGER